MEATFKIQPTEFDERLFRHIKKMFEGKMVTITITTVMDETSYLSANPANRKFLMESMAQEPTVSFTPDEFDKHVEFLLKQAI